MRKDTLSYKLKKGLTEPNRILPFLDRLWRNRNLKKHSKNFIEFYSQVVDSNATKINPDFAIGSDSQDHWLEVGKIQFDYLLKHRLKPHHKFLDIGCGNLRLGVHLIEYLNPGCYVGLDISPQIIHSAQQKIIDYNLSEKLPYIFLVRETDYRFLPESYFDYIHAHSVFSHLPIEEIRKVLLNAKGIMKPKAFFDFTYFASKEDNTNFLEEDFYYNTSIILNLVRECGYEALEMDDWKYIQDKIRAIKIG